MKASVIYIIGGLVLFLGILFTVIGFGLAGFNHNNFNMATEYEEKSYTSSGEITEIIADDENVSIEIKDSQDNKVHVKYFENNNTKYTVTENNGVLNISVKKEFKLSSLFNFNFQSTDLVIAVPEGYSGNLNIETSNASIRLAEVSAKDVYLKTSNASIVTESLKASGKLDFESSNGKIEINSTDGKDINAETSNAKIELYDVSVTEGITLRSSNGSIYFERISYTTEFNCKTSNSSVKGSLPGKISDYSIISDTSNGDNSLPNEMRAGEKNLEIKTSNGSIDIDFED